MSFPTPTSSIILPQDVTQIPVTLIWTTYRPTSITGYALLQLELNLAGLKIWQQTFQITTQ